MQRLVIFLAVAVVCAAVIVDVTEVPLLLKVLVTFVTLGLAGLVVKSIVADRSTLMMPAFMIVLRGYDITEVDRLTAKGEEAAASEDPGVREAMKAELNSVHLRRRMRGYATHQVDRAIKDLIARLG